MLGAGGTAHACQVFDTMPHWDTVSWNTMLTAYAYVGDTGTAASASLFGEMPDPDVVPWNTLLSGYCQRGMFQDSVVSPLTGQCSLSCSFSTLGVQIHACAGGEDGPRDGCLNR